MDADNTSAILLTNVIITEFENTKFYLKWPQFILFIIFAKFSLDLPLPVVADLGFSLG